MIFFDGRQSQAGRARSGRVHSSEKREDQEVNSPFRDLEIGLSSLNCKLQRPMIAQARTPLGVAPPATSSQVIRNQVNKASAGDFLKKKMARDFNPSTNRRM